VKTKPKVTEPSGASEPMSSGWPVAALRRTIARFAVKMQHQTRNEPAGLPHKQRIPRLRRRGLARILKREWRPEHHRTPSGRRESQPQDDKAVTLEKPWSRHNRRDQSKDEEAQCGKIWKLRLAARRRSNAANNR
jgi:hypothetical protein